MTGHGHGTVSSSLSNGVRHQKFLMEQLAQPFQRWKSKSVSLADNMHSVQSDGKVPLGQDDVTSLGLGSLNIKWQKSVLPSFCFSAQVGDTQ